MKIKYPVSFAGFGPDIIAIVFIYYVNDGLIQSEVMHRSGTEFAFQFEEGDKVNFLHVAAYDRAYNAGIATQLGRWKRNFVAG